MNFPYFIRISKFLAILALLVFPLLAAKGNAAEEMTETEKHIEVLKKKRNALKAEQDFLLFQKTFYESDSKYLILELSLGKGCLMYRTRILRSFNLERTGKRSRDPLPGIVAMTAKTDGNSRNRALLFGSALELHGKKDKDKYSAQAGYRLGKKDLAALYYALEPGTKAYIK